MTDMVRAIRESKKKKIKIWPCHTNRASSLGHPCLRFLVYNRTHWALAEPHSPELQDIFDDGHMHEKQMIKDLYDTDVEIYEQQMSLGEDPILKEANISAHLDWVVREEDGSGAPVDAKSSSTYSYDSINSYEDMVNSEKVWIMAYPGQLQLYCLAKNAPYGYFLFKNKDNAKKKQIKMDLDYGFAEELIQKGHDIERHLKNKTTPDRIEYKPNICDNCRHKITCNPEIPENMSLYWMDRPQFLEKVRRWDVLEEDGKEYNKLDREIKDVLKGTGRIKIVLGEYLLTCRLGQNDSQTWKKERLGHDQTPTGNCKDCGDQLDAGDALLWKDQCTKCFESKGR